MAEEIFSPSIFTRSSDFSRMFNQTTGKPCSFVILNDFLKTDFALKCFGEFSDLSGAMSSSFTRYSDPDFEFEKYTLNDTSVMSPSLSTLFEALHSEAFTKFVENVSGLSGLKIDFQRWGSGLHMTKPGGYLAVHRDFPVLPTSFKQEVQLQRVINIIGYLNPNWRPDWGGELQLWDPTGTKCEVEIEPRFNTFVLFDTRDTYHGHPLPFQGSSPRFSIASYYYLETKVPKEKWRSTDYLALPWRSDSPEYQRKRMERSNAEIRYRDLL